MPKDYPIRTFITSQKWSEWLDKNHASANGIWIRIYKKDSRRKTVTHDEALDEALCYGWIDGQRNSYDDESFIQKFTPRRAKSPWSKRNREKTARLIEEGRMMTAGYKEIEAAKKDGRWERAYDSPKNMQMPVDFLKELKKNKKAHAFFKTLNKTNMFAIAYRLHMAKKPETRERRMQKFIEMLENKEKLIK